MYRKNRGELIHNPQLVKLKDVLSGLPYSVIPFLLSMFIAVLSLDRHGITGMLSDRLFSIADSSLGVGLLFGFASALSSNVINNIPMSVLFTSILNNGTAGAYQSVAVYATIIGSNIGAFFSPIGALAGVMLMKILKDKENRFTALVFIKYCAPVAVVSLITSILVLLFVI